MEPATGGGRKHSRLREAMVRLPEIDGEAVEHFSGDGIAITGVVSAAGEDPGLAGGLEIRLAFPNRTSDRQLREFGMFDRLHFVHEQSKAVTQIDQRGVECFAGRRVEDHAHGIFLAAYAQGVDFDPGFGRGDARTNFEHMGAQHLMALGRKVIGVVLHEGRTAP